MCSDIKPVEAKCENLPQHIFGFDELLKLALYMTGLSSIENIVAISKSNYGIRIHYSDGITRFISYNWIN